MPKHIKTEYILNRKYGRLQITSDLGTRNHIRFVTAKCECGTIKEYRLASIATKSRTPTQSCGCLKRDVWAKIIYKHGLYSTKLHTVWGNIKKRCYWDKSKDYHNYGARGIRMHEEWKNDFKTFYDWSINNGWKEGLQIDRKNNNGNYEPSNCRFVSGKENCNNRRVTLFFDYNGERKCFSQWCKIYGLNRKLSHQRMNRDGISFDKLIELYGIDTRINLKLP